MPRPLSFLLLTAVLCLAACDSDDSSDSLPVYGDFSVTATPSSGTSVPFSGNAFARFDGDEFLSIMLSEADDEGRLGARSVLLSRTEPSPLHADSYAVGDPFDSMSDAPFTGVYTDFTGTLGGVTSDSGTVTIEAVTGEEVTGQFIFEGSGRPFTTDGPTPYEIRGTFEALIVREPGQRGTGDKEHRR